jgi:UDP-glucose 4-epimerase
MPLTVAVTGPTGDIGISAVEALEHEPDVDR